VSESETRQVDCWHIEGVGGGVWSRKTDRTGPRGDVADGVVRRESNMRWGECSKHKESHVSESETCQVDCWQKEGVGGGEIGKKKLTEKGLAVMLQMGCKVIERHYAGGGCSNR